MAKNYVHAMILGRMMLCEVVKPEAPKCASFMTGLDDGPWLPGRGPRKKAKPKSAEEIKNTRAKAWATRRESYGERGHR